MKKLALALMLSGCGYTVSSTVAEMAALDPLQADPAAIEIALGTPAGLAVQKGGARMTVDVSRSDRAEKWSQTYVLQAAPGAAAGVTVDPGSNLTVYRLAPADVARLRALQAEAASWKSETPPPKGSASIGLGVDACKTGAGPAPDARSSAYIRLAADGAFLPLIRPVPLRSVIGQAAFDAIAPCDGPS